MRGHGGVHVMDNPVRGYAWGSRTALAALAGRAPSGEPEAELWMGAHPGAPSLVGGRPLGELIAAHPHRVLGAGVLSRFGPRLPYLLKVLAVEQPLSLQVHPSAAQAELGFAEEEARGVPWNAPHRTYRDPYAKPEMVVSLGSFDALCGFREPAEALDLLDGLGEPALAPLVDDLRSAPAAEAIRSAFVRLVAWPREQRTELVARAAAAARASGGSLAYAWLLRLAGAHPGDPAALAPLLLRAVRLGAGEGLLLTPGVPHAYLSGTAVEIMGGSDNVLRAGLTAKHVDVPGLLRALVVDHGPVRVLRPRPAGVEEVWQSAVPEFRLSRVRVRGEETELEPRGPQVLLCLRGEVKVSADGPPVALGPTASAFAEATAPPVRLRGDGVVYRATVGDPL